MKISWSKKLSHLHYDIFMKIQCKLLKSELWSVYETILSEISSTSGIKVKGIFRSLFLTGILTWT